MSLLEPKSRERLQFPLDSFWVSYPYTSGGYISIGKFKETLEQQEVKSLGKGIVTNVDKENRAIEVRYYNKGRFVYTNLQPVIKIKVEVGNRVGKGEPIGFNIDPHLSIRCHVLKGSRKIIINPMREIYLHEHQINRSNVPNHTPRPVPIRR